MLQIFRIVSIKIIYISRKIATPKKILIPSFCGGLPLLCLSPDMIPVVGLEVCVPELGTKRDETGRDWRPFPNGRDRYGTTSLWSRCLGKFGKNSGKFGTGRDYWVPLRKSLEWYWNKWRWHIFWLLTPLYWPQVGRQTGAMSGEVFYGRSVRRLEGSRTVKGIVGRWTDGSFYFFLEPPK